MIVDSARGLADNAPLSIFWLQFCQGFWHFKAPWTNHQVFPVREPFQASKCQSDNDSPALLLNPRMGFVCNAV